MSESFYNRLTDLGEAEYAAAFANLTSVNLTHVALGDGNGAYYEPTKAQTALVREVYRASINSITIDTTNINRVIVEMIVPAAYGGWWIREVGIFSSTGILFAVGKFPATYKPLVSEGAGKELIVRLLFEVASSSVINLVIDPNLVVSNVANIISKVADHRNTETPNVVEIIKNDDYLKESLWYLETAAIARVSATQFTVVGDKTATYIKNRSLFLDQTTDAYGYVASATYSSGTELTTVTVCGCTVDSGLSVVKYGQEVANAPILTEVGGPIGSEMFWPTETPPVGYLEENGSAISRATYARLFSVIGTMYGVGDGSTTFNLPDARGKFPRIWDHGAGRDPDKASRTDRGDGTTGDHVGTNQADQFKAHIHTYKKYNSDLWASGDGGPFAFSNSTDASGSTGGNETRPINTNRMMIIRAY